MGDVVLSTPVPALQAWPDVLRDGDLLRIAFRAPRFSGATDGHAYEIQVLDERRRRVATVARGPLRPSGGVVCVEWDGCDDVGRRVDAGAYRLLVTRPPSTFALERTIFVER